MIEVDLAKLVNFCDVDTSVRCHASSIKGLACEELNLALLCHCINAKSKGSTKVDIEILTYRPTTKGSRLDAWLRVGLTYYQVEVKSWSFHGYGGGAIFPVEWLPQDSQYQSHVKALWNQYWDTNEFRFKEPRLNKVLLPMNQNQNFHVEPLACIWQALHPDGKNNPFYPVRCKSTNFNTVTIFSGSIYARNLLQSGTNKLTLDLPDTEARLALLKTIFS